MARGLEKAMRGVPRALEVVQKHANPAPLGQTPISAQESARRLEPLMGLYATGQIPLDETGSQAVAQVLDHMWRRAQGARR